MMLRRLMLRRFGGLLRVIRVRSLRLAIMLGCGALRGWRRMIAVWPIGI
ncbi:hypothetical protein Caci_6702 [Catenulispora acidiphila DSM 44928]|uniref:Uncharacterized protein n=1 Tax=Catenulispora acidiphila (strain DSM 44928 / JCM 14897 / NBRC 102108 / NRRL B-24433 / ID139908) TaxID=479433 RepID=C7Q055_CATAD|nr:hypothetical protein Caci_6702 [Catenulispora acidiphila DSM 44928]